MSLMFVAPIHGSELGLSVMRQSSTCHEVVATPPLDNCTVTVARPLVG
jgi:hypothetical protein